MNNEESYKAKQGQGMCFHEAIKCLNNFKKVESVTIIDPKNEHIENVNDKVSRFKF